MALRADHSRGTIRHVREGIDDPATYGITPALALLTSTIITTESFKGNVTIKESELSKPNRLPGGRRRTARDGGGDCNVEAAFTPEFDELLEDACCDLFYGVGRLTAVDISFANGDNSVSTLTANLFDGINVGDYIVVTGSAGNSKRFKVTSKPSGLKLVLASVAPYGAVVATEAAGPSVTISGGSLKSAAISASSIDNSINDASGLLFGNIPVGAWISMSGWAAGANNVDAYVSSKPTANKLILSYVVLTTEATGAALTIKGRILRDGVKLMTRTFERDRPEFSSNRYQAYKGQYSNGFELTFAFEDLIKGKFTYLGRGPEAPAAVSVGTGGPTAGTVVNGTNLVDASNNMTAFRTGGTLDGNIKSLTITLGNGGELIKLAQTPYPDGVSMGIASLSGSLEGYLLDADGRQLKAFNRTPDSYHFKIVDDNGKKYIFTIWRLFYDEQADVSKSARTGPTMNSLAWKAEEDPTTGHWFQVVAID